MSDVIIQVIKICKIFIQYLLLPATLLLTFGLPVVFRFINSRYVWFSIPLTVIIGLAIKRKEFIYYESRGLVIYFTLFQVAVMAVFILILKSIGAKRKK